jgi:hypothetical protein
MQPRVLRIAGERVANQTSGFVGASCIERVEARALQQRRPRIHLCGAQSGAVQQNERDRRQPVSQKYHWADYRRPVIVF